MYKLKNIILLCCLISIGACADEKNSAGKINTKDISITPISSSRSRQQKVKNSVSLPKNWKQLSYQGWIKLLAITECPARYDGNEERFKSFVDLSENDSLLLITCDLGAYQDAYYIFKLDQLSQSITALSFNLPSDDDVLKLDVKKLVWGAVYLSDSGGKLELLHLSSGSGMCGFLAYYSFADLQADEAINPEKIFGDEDCYNGISVEQWPEIKQ